MAKYYHGGGKRGPYFEGWYLKQQTPAGEALALIPAIHISRRGARSASLQILTEDKSWWLDYPAAKFRASERVFWVQLGKNRFSRRELRLEVEREGLSLHGTLRCGPFAPLRSDIMGPFRFLPGLECAHGVISMGHALKGSLTLNGTTLDFTGGTGYVETDRGRSFPGAYLWTQCVWRERGTNGLMLSIATVPTPVGAFTGCICAVRWQGREYRLATYRGVRIERWSGAGAVIRQGELRLEAELLEERSRPLRAPVEGGMSRVIRESLCAGMRYRFWRGERLLFEHSEDCAGFEYAAPPG